MFSSENFQGNKPCQLSSRLHICQNFHFKFKSLDLLFKCTCAYIIQQWDSFSDFSCFYRMKRGLNTERLKSLLISPLSNSVHPPILPTWHQSNLFCTHYYKPQIGHQPLPCSPPTPSSGLPQELSIRPSVLSHSLSWGPPQSSVNTLPVITVPSAFPQLRQPIIPNCSQFCDGLVMWINVPSGRCCIHRNHSLVI